MHTGTSASRPARALLGAFALLALGGCFGKTRFEGATPAYGGPPVKALYVYSFLDVRAKEIGAEFVSEFHAELVARLKRRGVDVRVLEYRNSPLGRRTYTLNWSTPVRDTGSTKVPVGEVIDANFADELAFGATHRLIVFPQILSMGGTISLRTRWDLIRAKERLVAWSLTSETSSTTGATRFIGADADMCIAAVLEQMERVHIVGPQAPQ